jgi:hypothetical protein
MEAVPGVTAMESNATGLTFNVAEPMRIPAAAFIVVAPPLNAFARPVLLIVPTEGWVELHRTDLVTSCWLPSLKVPVAENCWLWPISSEGAAGLTETAMRMGAGTVTFRVVEPAIELRVALIVVDPTEVLVAKPFALTVATVGLDEAQVTALVTSCWLPSL